MKRFKLEKRDRALWFVEQVSNVIEYVVWIDADSKNEDEAFAKAWQHLQRNFLILDRGYY